MSTSSSPSLPATPAKRACDSCHRRKVKCLPIGEDTKPCRNCVAAGLECTFYNKVQKKGPKGSRAKVLLEIRETQKLIYPRPPPDANGTVLGGSTQSERRSTSPSLFERTPGLVTGNLLDACVEYFFKNMYRTQPILHPAGVMQTVSSMSQSIEAYCTMAALCAYILLQPQSVLPPQLQTVNEYQQQSSKGLGRALADEAIRCRRAHDWSENPTLLSIYTSYFLSRCLHCLDRQDSAWIHLRQAVTVAHVLGLHAEATYSVGDATANFTTRKLFWTLLVTERIFAIKLHRPLSLYSTIRTPDPQEEPEGPTALYGFNQLIKLYIPLDDKFFVLWNRSGKELSARWFEQIQSQLSAIATTNMDLDPVVDVDLKVSRNWLRALTWQLLLMQDEVAPIGIDRSIAYDHLVEICREVAQICTSVSPLELEMHGRDMAEKICDIASVLSDGIHFLPYNHSHAARDHLHRLITVLLSLSTSHGRIASTIHEKAARHFAQPSTNPSPSSQAAPHYDHSTGNMIVQPDAMAMQQMGSYTMSVPANMTTPAGHLDGAQFSAILTDVTSGEYLAFNSHHPSSAGAEYKSSQGYNSYRYLQ